MRILNFIQSKCPRSVHAGGPFELFPQSFGKHLFQRNIVRFAPSHRDAWIDVV